ncbi:Sel1-repeat-containing protein YbeT [Patescibacteria group bacterium]|nr:Sel1-repeat-containing protein YbeT [Patescibacteria group bacterium]
MNFFLFFLSLLMLSASCFADFNQGVAAYQQGDYAAALKTWQKIAKQKPSKRVSADEIREAQYSLGLLYLQGQGVMQNYKETEKWLLLAANKGHSEAQSKLGNVYLTGLLGQSDTKKARFWFEKSALQGNVDGQYNLGVLYLDGVGVAKDVNLAKKWLSAAAQQGDKGAQDLLAEANNAVQQTPKPTQQTAITATLPQTSIASTPVSTDTDYYAVQLFSSPNQADALQFIEKWQTTLNPLLNTDKMKQSQQLFIVAYGSFSSMMDAKQAITDLPSELKKNRPWVIKMRGNHLAN